MGFTNYKNNNFALVRMIAAYMVIYAHSFAIQGVGGADIVTKFSRCTHAGQMAVFIFIFLSGVFIMKSIMNGKSIVEFAVKRFARIYPAMVVALILVLFVGAFFTRLSAKEYWLNSQVWNYLFSNMEMIYNEHVLPGVFENHPYQGMNGVLWFITFQFRIYFIMGFLASLNLFKDKKNANIVLLILITVMISVPHMIPLIGSESTLIGDIVFPQYAITFFVGCLLYLNMEYININIIHILLLICGMYAFRNSSIGIWYWGTCFIVFALYIGTRKRVLKIKVPLDCSYGIFLYGWPVGQVFVELFPKVSAYYNIIFTIIISTVLSILSYYLIEKNAVKISKRFLNWYLMIQKSKTVESVQ